MPGTDLEPQASVLVPLRFMGAVIGLLAVDRLAGRTFEERELEIVQLFANLAAIAIRNARSYKEMEVQASTDGLTGLFNHRRFQEALALEVARAERYDTEFCLLMLDLDRFKSVNDTVGHQRGDEVLRDVADVLRRCSRESDFAARYGGEEFTMILPHADVDEARRVAERVRGQVADLSAVEPGLLVTVSVGVASFPHDARRHRRHPGRGRRRAALRQEAWSQLRLHVRRRRSPRRPRRADAAGRVRPPLRAAGRLLAGRG